MSTPYAPYFKLEKKDYIATITLSRPEKFNTIASPFWEALVQLERELINDKSVRVVVFLAEGKHFSAGTDLDDLKKDRKTMDFGNGRNNYHLYHWQDAYHFLESFDIPVIVGIHGACFGSAVELAAAADIRIASTDSKYFMGEVKAGMSCDLGGTTRLTRLLGRSQAMRLLLTGERIDAQEALRIGLVDKVVPLEELRDTVMETAKTIASMSPFAVMTTKRVVNIASEGGTFAGLAAERINGSFGSQTNDRLRAMQGMMSELKEKVPYAPEFNLD